MNNNINRLIPLRELMVVIVSLGLYPNSHAATIRVPQDQPTITAAVAAANPGDSILINDGTYNEHGIVLTKPLSLRSVNGSSATTVDGQNLGGVFQINLPDSNLVMLQGLTIKHGDVRGGWATIRRLSGMIEVRDCVFEQNYANGGVIDARGGADYSILDPGKTWVVDCIFRNNSAENYAGVLGVTAIRCLFYGNTGWNSPVVIGSSLATNCTAYNNTGGVLSNPWTTGGASASTLNNCILWGNSGYNGQQINGTSTVVTYSIVQGGWNGTGNLSSEPLFVNAAGGDFHLQIGSPGINSGDPSILDVDGTRSDMGAYGGNFTFQPCVPHRATATATVVNGFVVGATITDKGCGYTNTPFVMVSGDGTGATAMATVSNGEVTGITIVNPGSGYGTNTVIKIGSPPFMPSLDIGVSKVNVTLHLVLGRNYILLSSKDLKTWTQVGAQFTAQDELVSQEFAVSETGQYFRIQEVP